MPRTRNIYVILLGALLFGLAGCSDKVAERTAPSDASAKATVGKAASRSKKVASATNNVAMSEAFPGATSNELAHIRACFDAIDEGRDLLAMRHARELMDSTNAEIRLQAVEAFGWIGGRAVSELGELMADTDEEVCSEAQRQWEMAFDDLSREETKMRAIKKTATSLKNQHSLEAVMMKLTDLEDHNAVQVLCEIITSTNSTPVAVEVSREEYASLAGEPFLDAKRAEQVVANLKNQSEGLLPEPPKGQHLKTK